MAAAALSGSSFVPLCTSSEGSDGRGLRLHNAGVDVLNGAKLAARKIALVGVLNVAEDEKTEPERGLFLSSSAASVAEQDASMLLLVLRGVSLADEPFWGSLLFVLSSHVVVSKAGPPPAPASRPRCRSCRTLPSCRWPKGLLMGTGTPRCSRSWRRASRGARWTSRSRT